jgi:GxxExxY protein
MMPRRPVLTTITRMTPKRPDTAPATRRLLHEDLTREIISAFYEVYNTLGYGFLESVYTRALFSELTRRGLHVQGEVMLDVYYNGECVGSFRADMLVEYRVVVEIKASTWLVDADRNQLLNYLRSSCLEVGLLLHFGPRPRFKRVVAENVRNVRLSNQGVSASSASS